MTCPLCGNKFTDYIESCESCILNKTCKLVCCPNCGYKFPQESKIINFFAKKLKREKTNAKT